LYRFAAFRKLGYYRWKLVIGLSGERMPQRPSIFISYSHQDEVWKDRLVQQLGVLEEQGLFTVWHDREVGLGAAWSPEIERAIQAARVAILLVSSDFLTSDFIQEHEIPQFLQRRQYEGLLVVPVIVRPCPWKRVPWLSAIQVRPTDGKPLVSLDWETELARLAEDIGTHLQAASPAPEAFRHTFPQHGTSRFTLGHWAGILIGAVAFVAAIAYAAHKVSSQEVVRERVPAVLPAMSTEPKPEVKAISGLAPPTITELSLPATVKAPSPAAASASAQKPSVRVKKPVAPKTRICSENEHCAGQVLACQTSGDRPREVEAGLWLYSPISREYRENLVSRRTDAIAWGDWSNPECARDGNPLSGSGWHARIGTCETGRGEGWHRCVNVRVQLK
jgi:TIR domain